MNVIHGGLSGSAHVSISYFNQVNRLSHYVFVNELSSYIQLLKENVQVTVLLEWLTALLEYLDLAFTE